MCETWECEAYGPEGAEVGAFCYFASDHQRLCGDRDECHRMMQAERIRVFDRITELAAEGDQVASYLATEFTSPDQLLGGAADEPPAGEQ